MNLGYLMLNKRQMPIWGIFFNFTEKTHAMKNACKIAISTAYEKK